MIENKEFEGEETNPKMLGKDLGKENFKETFRKIQVILEQLQSIEGGTTEETGILPIEELIDKYWEQRTEGEKEVFFISFLDTVVGIFERLITKIREKNTEQQNQIISLERETEELKQENWESEEEKDHADGLRIPRTSESTFISPLTSPRFGATYYASSQALKKSRSNLTLSSPTQKKFSLTRSRGNSVDKKLERANEDVEKKYWEERVRKITFEKDQVISKLEAERNDLKTAQENWEKDKENWEKDKENWEKDKENWEKDKENLVQKSRNATTALTTKLEEIRKKDRELQEKEKQEKEKQEKEKQEKEKRVKELERIISKLSREKQELAEKNLLYAKEIFAKKEELSVLQIEKEGLQTEADQWSARYQEAEQTIIHYQQQLEEEEEIHNIFSLEPEKVSSDQENLVSNHTLLDELEEAQKKLSEDDKLTTIKETLIANYRLDEKEREWLMSVEKNDWAKITQIIVDIQLKRFKQRIKGSFFTPCQKSETGLSSPASSSASFFSEPIIGTNPLTTTPGRITPVERRNSYFGGFFPEFSRISTNESTCSACGKIRFENENEDKQEELENLQRKNSELVRENRKLQKENRRLKSESGSFEIKNGELKKQVMEVGSKLESSSEGLKELSLEKIDKEIELKNLNEEKKKVEEEKAKVEEQLQKAEEKNSEEKNSKQELELERRNKIIIRQGVALVLLAALSLSLLFSCWKSSREKLKPVIKKVN